MKKILVPTDFGQEAKKSYNVARRFAERHDAEIVLFHILPSKMKVLSSLSLGIMGNPSITEVKGEVAAANEQMGEIIKSGAFGVKKVSTKILQGEEGIANDVLHFFNEEEHELVILGTAGEDKSGESNAEIISRKSTIPVLTVHKEVDHFDVTHILLPTDFKSINRKFIQKIVHIKEVFGAKLTILFINTPKTFKETEYLNREWKLLKNRHHLENIDFDCYNSFDIESGISRYGKKHNVDLIALPTHGRRGIDRLFTTSYVEDIINNSEIPVYSYNLHNDDAHLPGGTNSSYSGGFG